MFESWRSDGAHLEKMEDRSDGACFFVRDELATDRDAGCSQMKLVKPILTDTGSIGCRLTWTRVKISSTAFNIAFSSYLITAQEVNMQLHQQYNYKLTHKSLHLPPHQKRNKKISSFTFTIDIAKYHENKKI